MNRVLYAAIGLTALCWLGFGSAMKQGSYTSLGFWLVGLTFAGVTLLLGLWVTASRWLNGQPKSLPLVTTFVGCAPFAGWWLSTLIRMWPNHALHSDAAALRRLFPRSLRSLGAGERGRWAS